MEAWGKRAKHGAQRSESNRHLPAGWPGILPLNYLRVAYPTPYTKKSAPGRSGLEFFRGLSRSILGGQLTDGLRGGGTETDGGDGELGVPLAGADFGHDLNET